MLRNSHLCPRLRKKWVQNIKFVAGDVFQVKVRKAKVGIYTYCGTFHKNIPSSWVCSSPLSPQTRCRLMKPKNRLLIQTEMVFHFTSGFHCYFVYRKRIYYACITRCLELYRLSCRLSICLIAFIPCTYDSRHGWSFWKWFGNFCCISSKSSRESLPRHLVRRPRQEAIPFSSFSCKDANNWIESRNGSTDSFNKPVNRKKSWHVNEIKTQRQVEKLCQYSFQAQPFMFRKVNGSR